VLLARLSVFTGAWTIAASEAAGIADGDLDAVDTLAALVAQSLVRIDESDPGEPRFRMLETVRAYAAERLAERGETDAETVDNDYLRAQVLDMLGLDAATAGNMTGARDRYSAGAALHARLLDYEGSAYCLSGLAGLALAQKRPRVSARLIGASDYARRIVGVAVWPGMRPIDQAQRTAVTAALSPASFTAASAEGARMRIPDALAYGLAATAADQVSDPFSDPAFRLRPAT
jgi:hypothetical protein